MPTAFRPRPDRKPYTGPGPSFPSVTCGPRLTSHCNRDGCLVLVECSFSADALHLFDIFEGSQAVADVDVVQDSAQRPQRDAETVGAAETAELTAAFDVGF